MSAKAAAATAGRIINKNKFLFGPGPVNRVPPKYFPYSYAHMDAEKGFQLCAFHATIFALVTTGFLKYFFWDPELKAIEDYYKENP